MKIGRIEFQEPDEFRPHVGVGMSEQEFRRNVLAALRDPEIITALRKALTHEVVFDESVMTAAETGEYLQNLAKKINARQGGQA